MTTNQLTCHEMARELSPATNPVGRYPAKEGANLPNSATEDELGISICRKYNDRQLRRINRLNSLHGPSKAGMFDGERLSDGRQAFVQAKKHRRSNKIRLDIEQGEME